MTALQPTAVFIQFPLGNGTGTPEGTPGCPPVCTGIYPTGSDGYQRVQVPAGLDCHYIHTVTYTASLDL
jgi:hypothetical protein